MEREKRYTITLDDDPMVSKFIARATGIPSLPFTSSQSLQSNAFTHEPAAVFIDVHLGLNDSGLDSVPELRERWLYTPIIVVTGDIQDDLVGRALALGANDFIRKPIQVAELTGRLHARLSEMNAKRGSDVLSILDFKLYRSKRAIEKEEKITYLPLLETQLLVTLLENRDMLVSRDELKRKLWGSVAVSDNTLDKKISTVRRAFADIGSIMTVTAVYGQGVMAHSRDLILPQAG